MVSLSVPRDKWSLIGQIFLLEMEGDREREGERKRGRERERGRDKLCIY